MKPLTNIAQIIGISVGIGLLVSYPEEFWIRTLGLIVLIISLDWRYNFYDRKL